MPLLVAAVLSAAALAAILALVWHASASRDNEDQLDDVTSTLNLLQDMPWRLEAPGSARPAVLTADLVAATFRSHDVAIRALAKAKARYRAQANEALDEATVGSVVIVVLLLSGFALFYRRSFRARRAAEQLAHEVEHAKAHLEQAQRVAGLGSWEWDLVEERLMWSAEHARMHGWAEPKPPADPAEMLPRIADEDRGHVVDVMQSAIAQGRPAEFEYRLKAEYGGRLIQLQATPVTDTTGRTTRLIGISRDVTDRFRRDEAERANSAKTAFISRMSHELRTPLNAILGFGQLMTMSDLDERQRGNVEHILSGGRHLLDLINELLDISRIESGELRLASGPVSARTAIAETIDLVTPGAIARGIEVSVEAASEDVWVQADAQRLKQVLLNLLSNAVKYNDPGGRVHVRGAATSADRVVIVVEDDGPGIDPSMLDRLFSPFDRLGAEQGPVEGTGLGLALSRGMIEAMGGRIDVRTEVGRGSAFTVELVRAAGGAPAKMLRRAA